MKSIKSCFFMLVTLAITGTCIGEGFIAPKGGIAFPLSMKDLHGSERVVWNIGAEWGGLTDVGVGFGGSFDLFWQRSYHATEFDNIGTIQSFDVNREIRRTMFPLCAVLYVDPWYKNLVHPSFKGSFGPAMLIYTNREYIDSLDKDELSEHSGVYWGSVGKVGVDVHVNISDEVSIFLGGDYHWSSLTKRKWGTNRRFSMNMSGPVIRIGVRFL